MWSPIPEYSDYMEIGVRELKAQLSEFLDKVEQGEVVTVTRRGRRIAQIVPVGGGDRVAEGLAEGWLVREADQPPHEPRPAVPLEGTPTTTALIAEDRGA